MKKLLIALLLTNLATAQHVYFASGIDLRNAIIGSDPTNNKPELNYSLEFKMVGNNNFEAGIGFEQFNIIDFNRMYFTAGYRFEIGEFTIIPTIEPTIINRYGNWGGGIDYDMKQSFMTIGIGSALEYSFNDAFGVQLYFSALPRPDIKMMYEDNKIVISGFAKIIYKINL
jgi:hypothetical protein